MDTRSVVRSCRRSSRLTGQPPHDERVRQAITGNRRHHSDHDTPARTDRNASREGSCPQIGSHSKTSSSHDAYLETPQTDVTYATTDATADATAAVTKTEVEDPVFPLSHNLRSSKSKATGSSRAATDSITVTIEDPIKTSSESAFQDHATTKWVKTARGSIRLASDSPAESSKTNEGKRSDDNEEAQNASFATTRRRSKRLASMTPDVTGDTIEVEPIPSRHTVGKTKAVATKSHEPDAAGDSAEQESESDLPVPSTRAMSEHDPITQPIHQEDFLIYDENPEQFLQDPDDLQNTSPIPELVADIERIIQSSPMADRYSADDSTKHASGSTPTKALLKKAPSIMATNTRTLRSSSRSVESTSNIAKRPASDQTDSESSQLDGAFDDSIRGRKKKKARVAGDTANTFKPSELRGTKRGAKNLSQGNVDTPGPRQRRKPNSGVSKPEEDLSSANPIERATSRDSFLVDDPEIENPLDIGEFVRRSDEPVNPVMLAQMISTNQERADSDIDSTAAEYGGDSDSIAAESGSDIDSMAAEYGSQGSSRYQSPGGDTPKCADCGRTPKRYLVCAKCKEAIYCGKYCQIWNWPLHKTRCLALDEADQAEIETQEAYLEDMWAAALKVLKEEKMAGGTVESLLLGEAVRHSPARPAFMGQRSPRGFVGFDVGDSQSAGRDAESVDRTRAMSMRLAQAALGNDQ